MISGANDSPISLRFILQESLVSPNSSHIPEDVDHLSPENAITSLEEKHKRDLLSIEKLDSCIKQYGVMYAIRMKIYNAVTGLISAQSITYSTAGTASLLATTANPTPKSSAALMSANTSLTTFVNALTFGIQLYLSCKSRVTWKRALKLRKHLENPSTLPIRQVGIESAEIRKAALKKISFFIRQAPNLLAKTFANDQKEKSILSELHVQKEHVAHLFEEKQHLQKHLEQLTNHLFEHLAQDSEKWHALQQVVEQEANLEQKQRFQEIAQEGDIYKALQENRETLQKYVLTPAMERTRASQVLDKSAGILDRVVFLLQEAAKIEEGRQMLQNLGFFPPTPLPKKDLEALILANAHKIKSIAVNIQNTYIKKLLRTIHIDLDRLQATAYSEESMQQVLERQKEKAQKSVQHLQGKIELILQSPNIYKILSDSSLNKKKQLKQILPSLSIPDEVEEHHLISFIDKLFSDYKTGFRLKELATQEVQGYDLRVTKERLDYLSKALGVVVFSQEDQKLKSAIESGTADIQTISRFSKELAKKTFGHQTALEQSVKNGLEALAAQKLHYALDLEGGKWTKPAALFVRGVYLFSSLATCICLPLMATGILTIPAAALLIFSKVLYLITTISLGSGLAYWRKNAPYTFKQSQKEFLSNVSENLLWIKDRIKMAFGYDLQQPTEFDLLSKKRKLLIQKRRLLVLQSAITDLNKKIIQTEKIQEKTSIFGLSKNFTLEEHSSKVGLLQEELAKTQYAIDKIQSTLSNWEKRYADQHPSGVSDMQKARIKDMSESTLKKHLVNPIKLAFASLFEDENGQTINTKALALSDAITKMFLENTLSTELELLFEALGMSIEDIKVQVETERLKKEFPDADKLEKQVKAEVEQALGQFFGGTLEQITHTDQLGLEVFNKALKE